MYFGMLQCNLLPLALFILVSTTCMKGIVVDGNDSNVMYPSVCVYISKFICVHICTCACTYAHTHTHMHIHTHAHACTHTKAQTHMH